MHYQYADGSCRYFESEWEGGILSQKSKSELNGIPS